MKHLSNTRPKGGRKWVFPLLAVLALMAGGLAAALVLTPGYTEPVFGGGELLISMEGDGSAWVTWPEAETAHSYTLSLRGEGEEDYTLRGESGENRVRLEGFPPSTPVEVRIEAVTMGRNVLGMERPLRAALDVTVLSPQMTSPVVEAVPSAADKTLSLTWDTLGETQYHIYLLGEDGSWIPQSVTNTGTAVLSFGDGADLQLPSHGQPVQMAVRPFSQGDGYGIMGPLSETVAVDREAFLGDTLYLEYREDGERMYTLQWNETKGEHYEVQEWTDGQWNTLARVEQDGELCYETGRLPSGTNHRYRVVACRGDAAGSDDGDDFSAEPSEVSFRTAVTPLYCTVWPVVDVPFYSDVQQSAQLSTVKGGAALCVLGETGDWFHVRHQGQYGYVDSRFCMIDLSEYLGDLCAYHITNSYRSVFMVHDYDIPNVTGQTIPGFRHIRTEGGRYLVPYLYPSAKKLHTAAQAALADGYRLKIYDAYRPNEATRYLYDTTSQILDAPVPGQEELMQPPPAPETPLPEDGEPVEIPAVDLLTYGEVMTDGRYKISSFLAASVSAHNRGIALDLTLESLETGKELTMQSAMHDLSWYSAASRNNDNAKLLASYMTGAGLRGLTSEWWHFQDDETREEIQLTSYLYKGVSPEGWKRDDRGWRYREADGSYRRGGPVTVDGVQYTLDAEGYATS